MGSIPIRQSLWFNMDKTQISIMVGNGGLFGVAEAYRKSKGTKKCKIVVKLHNFP